MKIKPLYLSWENVHDIDDNITGDIYVVFGFEHEGHRCACNIKMCEGLLDCVECRQDEVVDFVTKTLAKAVNKYTKGESITAKHLYGSVVTILIKAYKKEPFVLDYRKNPIQ